MSQLNLICAARRLKNWDNTGTDWMCGLILSPATDDGKPIHEEGLKPWLWPAITTVYYALLDGSNAVIATGTATTFGGPTTQQTAAVKPLLDKTDAAYALSASNPENLKWKPIKFADSGRVTYTAQLQSNGARPWASLVGKMATYPFPIAQAAHLSLLFRVPFNNKAVKLIAVPEVPASGSFPSTKLTPTGTPQTEQGDPRIFSWDYSGPGDWPVKAYVAPVATDPTAGSGVTDIVSQWIQVAEGETILQDEWLGQMEHRIADVFDMSQRILDFAATSDAARFFQDPSDRQALQEMVVASLRDVAGVGWDPAPDGAHLLARLMDLAKAPFSDKETKDLTAAASTLQPNLDQWRALLQATVLSAKDLAILKGTVLDSRQAISEMSKLHEAALDTDVEASLLSLLKQHWNALLTKAALTGRDIDATVKSALDQAKATNVRHQLALSNLGRLWNDLVLSNIDSTDRTGHKLVEVCVPAYFQYYFAFRFGLTIPASSVVDPNVCAPPTGSLSYWPAITVKPSNALRDRLLSYVKDWGASFAKTLIPKGPVQKAKTPQPVAFQLGKLQAIPEEKDGFEDLLDQFSGVGLLLREQSKQWQCLNLTDVATGDERLSMPDKAPVLAPYRVNFKSGLRQVCLSYSNQSIFGDSLMSGLTSRRLKGDGVTVDPLLHYVYNADVVFPALKYGAKYDCRAFLFANSGVLPRDIANEKSPRELDIDKLAALGGGTSFSYLRRMPVGHLHITPQDKDSHDAQFPAIPANVFPRARDIATLATDKDTYAAAIDALKKEEERRDIPLLLLHESFKQFGFSVRRPRTTWDNWLRWVAVWPNFAAKQAEIVADYFRVAELNEAIPKGQPGADLTVDDPALNGPDAVDGQAKLYLQLQKCNKQGNLNEKGHIFVPFLPPTDTKGLPSQRAPGIPVQCTWSDTAADGISITGGTVNVTVEKGQVYRLSIFACLPKTSISTRFDTDIVDSIAPDVTDGGITYAKVSPYYVNIEAATFDLPDKASLWDAFKASFEQKDGGASLTVSVDGSKQADVERFAHVHRIELRRQVWRWQGRITARHPLIDDPTKLSKVPEWEAREFGDRPESDHLLFDMTTMPPGPDGTRNFIYVEDLERKETASSSTGSTILHELRSLHARFAVRAFSRYDGLNPPNPFVEAKTQVLQSPGAGMIDVHWKSVFVPCRRRTNIPVPKVRLILPLTETSSPDSKNPGLLVVLSEAWHEIGGLAEQLEVDVAHVEDPDPSNPPESFFYELGPDPIVTSKVEDPLSKPYTNGDVVTMDKVTGPVGHYFDANNTAAYFPATSFIVPAPNVKDMAKPNYGWYFAKLRLRRTLDSATQIGVKDTKTGAIDYRTQKFTSPWTEPFWAQYLPSFSIFEENALTDGTWRVRVQPDGKSLSLVDRFGVPRVLQPFPSQAAIFTLFAVLTRKVFDVTGRRDQEQYLGLYERGDNGIWKLADPPALAEIPESDAPLRVRVLEVQSKARVAASTLWSGLFGKTSDGIKDNLDVELRIVRISEPVESSVLASVDCEGNHG